MAEVEPDQAGLRRLGAAFGFVEVLAVVDHEADQDEGDNEAVEDQDATIGPSLASVDSCHAPTGETARSAATSRQRVNTGCLAQVGPLSR